MTGRVLGGLEIAGVEPAHIYQGVARIGANAYIGLVHVGEPRPTQ